MFNRWKGGSGQRPRASRGVRGHVPPENFGHVIALRCNLVNSGEAFIEKNFKQLKL